ncbi:MAG TPA: hypothetical protein VFH54_15980 [Mycobacteriales bacterium]|jgi:hypothetical protein|nr:hypothetical protein [Mycobacteriales bacterium]
MNNQFEFGVLRSSRDRLLTAVDELGTLKPWLELLGVGLFRAPDTDVARALLATRYASPAEWERSRHAIAAESGEQAEAGKRFRRRQEITKRTIVRVAPPL